MSLRFGESTFRTCFSSAVNLARSVSSLRNNRSFRRITFVKSASFFIPSTLFCSLFSRFTSSCTCHFITVTVVFYTSILIQAARPIKPQHRETNRTMTKKDVILLQDTHSDKLIVYCMQELFKVSWRHVAVNLVISLYPISRSGCVPLHSLQDRRPINGELWPSYRELTTSCRRRLFYDAGLDTRRLLAVLVRLSVCTFDVDDLSWHWFFVTTLSRLHATQDVVELRVWPAFPFVWFLKIKPVRLFQ